MCGRYMLTTPVDALRQLFRFKERPNLPPRYNIAPTQDVPIVRRTRDGAGRELIMVRWGLVPYWASDPKIGNRLINARGESVARTAAFREAYQRRRCLVPADGFFEWRKDGGTRVPLLVRRRACAKRSRPWCAPRRRTFCASSISYSARSSKR